MQSEPLTLRPAPCQSLAGGKRGGLTHGSSSQRSHHKPDPVTELEASVHLLGQNGHCLPTKWSHPRQPRVIEQALQPDVEWPTYID